MQLKIRTLKQALASLIADTALMMSSGAAHADVVYSFTAETSYANFGTGSFVFTSPTFVSVSTFVPVEDLDACTSSLGSCGTQGFIFNAAYDTISFRPDQNTSIYYYFNPGVFSQYGTFETVLFGADQHGTLTITEVDAQDVPEPAHSPSLRWRCAALARFAGSVPDPERQETPTPGEGRALWGKRSRGRADDELGCGQSADQRGGAGHFQAVRVVNALVARMRADRREGFDRPQRTRF